MERRVKERLVGAAVLMSAAVILIPEMLSGPTRTHDEAPRQNDTPLKTYTIDLNRSPGTVVPVEERAPPQEAPAPSPSTAISQAEEGGKHTRGSEPIESAQGLPDVSPDRQVVQPPPPSAPVRTADAATKPKTNQTPAPTQSRSARDSAPSTPAAQPSVPKTPGWAVQVGSFANRATADRLAKELAGSGHNAFVMPVKSGGTTLYRVRIGPFGDRAEADGVLASVKKRVANAAIVPHP